MVEEEQFGRMERARGNHLADFTRDRRLLTLSGMAMIVGVASALISVALVWLIGVITNLAFYGRVASSFVSPASNHLGAWVVLVPAVGGLIIGLMARYGSEQIRGHGIPEALEAILAGRSRMKLRVALLKPLSSAVSIGTGGPFGAEGPIIMTGGAFGSLFAQLFHLSSAERKTLLVAGAAGGMAAIFAAPVAAVLLAVELLLFEWKPRSFIPVALAAGVAGALRVPLMGPGPVFGVPPHSALPIGGLALALGVGLLAGVGSGALTTLVYAFEDLFQKLPLHWMWWPVIGGLVVGIGGLVDPRVLGVGYDTIRALLRGDVIGVALISLLIVKALVWSFALGSGTSGGVLAPLLILGAALGAIEAHFIPGANAGVLAIVSMAAMMAGTMRAPLTAMVFTLELTHDLNLLPALLLACVAADAVTVLLLPRSILTEKVARRGLHLTREYTVDVMQVIRVGDVMARNVATVPASMIAGELARRIASSDPQFKRAGIPIVDQDGYLKGIVTRGDVLRAVESDASRQRTVFEVGSRSLVVAYPDELLSDAVGRMLRAGVGRLPVVSRNDPHRLVGYLGRPEILAARLRRLDEEDVRERTWTGLSRWQWVRGPRTQARKPQQS
jgi:chloride channel protein, CIC family